MAKTPSTDLAPVVGKISPTTGDLVVPQSGATSQDLLYAIRNGLKLWVEESTATEAEFLERTLTSDATTDEGILGGGPGLEKLEDLLNVRVKITGYQGMRNVAPQYLDNSLLGVYVIVDLTDADGVVHTVSIGSSDNIGKIVKMVEADAIPQSGATVFEKSEKATKSGFYPINMRYLDSLVDF